MRGTPPRTRTPNPMDAVTLPQTAFVSAWAWPVGPRGSVGQGERRSGAAHCFWGARGPPRTAGLSPATEDLASDARGISALRLLGSVFIW